MDGGGGRHSGARYTTAAGPGAQQQRPVASGGPSGTSGAMSGNRRFSKQMTVGNKSKEYCRACGGDHDTAMCKFKVYVCRICNRQGHLKRMCPNNVTEVYNVQEEQIEQQAPDYSDCGSDEVNTYCIDSSKLQKFAPYTISVNVDEKPISMEIDTGSVISCISYEYFMKSFPNHKLNKTDLVLRYYTGEIVEPAGKITCTVSYNGISKELDLYIVHSGKANLLGRQWLKELCISLPVYNCNNVRYGKQVFDLNEFSSRYYDVFADGLGKFTGGTVGIRVRPDTQPVFLRTRPLAYALREPVERALEQHVRDGVLTPVSASDWATPIVPVMKKDGSVRICADFKVTLNKCIDVDRFPLPRIDDLLAKLHGGEKYTKIDLSQAYAQFELNEESKKFTVINTHKGLFRYNRLIFGLASSPGIFQRKIEQMFSDMPKVGVFLDDIILTGVDEKSHLATLHEVFKRLQKFGLKIRKDKCTFFADSVTYLGFVISKKGVHTCPEKIEAIKNVKVPTNVTELRSFLGMVMYYAKFVPNISTVLSPLYTLLKKDVKFVWNDLCDKAFNKVKQLLISSTILCHYSPDLPLILTTDASSVGIGAVISHVTPEGERPIAYAARTLNSAEKCYSQIEREALSIIFGIRKFHHYLYGRKFTLKTDHKPLVTIFGNKVGIPIMAASRMQRWAVLLSGYHYDIDYVRSENNAADALSRLSVCSSSRPATVEKTYLNFVQNYLPLTRKSIQESVKKDEVLQKVILYIQSGWPSYCADEVLKPYFVRRNELYIDLGCIVWGYRLVIPKSLQETILSELHTGHIGIVKMKSLARSIAWWPGIDADIERKCKQCGTCAAESPAPARSAPRPWRFEAKPWTRLHVDFLGPIHGRTFLIIIDSTSKWLEVFHMTSTTASAVIKVLRETFARFGLPAEVVSDNGPPFTSKEYCDFLRNNGIAITYSAAYHPSSNGAAEGAVKLCKRAVKKSLRDGVDVEVALQTYLLAYRNVEHSTTGASPAMLLQHRSLRSRLDLLRGDRQLEDRVQDRQRKQAVNAGGGNRGFSEGDRVWVRNYSGGRKWVEGQVEAVKGTRNYIVGREDGSHVARHVDQIKNRWWGTVQLPSSSEPSPSEAGDSEPTNNTVPQSEQTLTVPPLNFPGPTLRPRENLRPPKRYMVDFD